MLSIEVQANATANTKTVNIVRLKIMTTLFLIAGINQIVYYFPEHPCQPIKQ